MLMALLVVVGCGGEDKVPPPAPVSTPDPMPPAKTPKGQQPVLPQ